MKKNPNDTTFRNINALKKKDNQIIRQLDLLEHTLDILVKNVSRLQMRIQKLERSNEPNN